MGCQPCRPAILDEDHEKVGPRNTNPFEKSGDRFSTNPFGSEFGESFLSFLSVLSPTLVKKRTRKKAVKNETK